MIADFTGSAPQAVGPVNAIYAVTASAIYNAFLHLTDPTIPRNEGCYRPFTIIAPPGTIVNCSFPAPVAGGNTETSPRITDMVFGALQHAIPDARRRLLRRHLVAVPLRRHRPADRRAVRPLPLRGRRLGRPQGHRRQQHGRHDQRQLPQHAGRGVRDALPRVPDRVVPARHRLRRPGRVPRRPRRRAGLHRHRARGDGERAPEPDEDGALGRARRRRGRRRRALGAARPGSRSGGRSSRSSGRCRRRSSPA